MNGRLNIFYFALVSLLGLPFVGVAMDPGLSLPEVTFMTSAQGNVTKTLIDEINQVPKDGTVKGDYWFIKDPKWIQAFKDAAQRGVQVQITLRNQAANKPVARELMDAGVDVRFLDASHCKTTAVTKYPVEQLDAHKNSPHAACVVLGSNNPSLMSYKNDEIMALLTNTDVYKQYHAEREKLWNNAYPLTNAGSPCKTIDDIPLQSSNEFSFLTKTPIKTTFCNSIDTRLLASKIDLLNRAQPNDVFTICSMNICPDFAAAAIKGAQRGAHICVVADRSALKAQVPALQNMVSAGVDVRIINANGAKKNGIIPTIMHEKTVVRTRGDQQVIVVSNANLTHEGDKQPNFEVWIPQSNKETSKCIFAENDRLTRESVPLEQALVLYNKSKLSDDNSLRTEKKRLNDNSSSVLYQPTRRKLF